MYLINGHCVFFFSHAGKAWVRGYIDLAALPR